MFNCSTIHDSTLQTPKGPTILWSIEYYCLHSEILCCNLCFQLGNEGWDLKNTSPICFPRSFFAKDFPEFNSRTSLWLSQYFRDRAKFSVALHQKPKKNTTQNKAFAKPRHQRVLKWKCRNSLSQQSRNLSASLLIKQYCKSLCQHLASLPVVNFMFT